MDHVAINIGIPDRLVLVHITKKVGRFSSNKSPWRNWLARPTVNREVGSSSLPGDVFFIF